MSIERMKSLIKELNEATEKYDAGKPIMTDAQWDEKYFELVSLERASGISFSDSPSNSIHFISVSKLAKVEHNHKMLSLDKTKEIGEVNNFIGSKDAIAMLKMDGLTCSLRYVNGLLVGAETRGNGTVGEDIFHNAMVIPSIPRHIEMDGELVVDGEIICSYSDFEEFSGEYKNPRNFAAGSIRLLDAKECSKRKLQFVAWDAIAGCKEETLHGRIEHLKALGFVCVPYHCLDKSSVEDTISTLQDTAKEMSYPIDGIVFKYDDCAYYQSLGSTDHHFRGGLAYKFYDEEYETRLKLIDWTMGRTGVLTPVAVFEPIDIDGTTVERASLHNYSVMRETLGSCAYVGQKITVFKANQIIPQISSAVKMDYGTVISLGGVTAHDEPEICPCCSHGTAIVKSDDGVLNMTCSNPACEGKIINRLDHFAGKKGLDIKGLSKMTIEKLIDWGWITCLKDVLTLKEHKAEWVKKPGFGEKSVTRILDAIETATTNVDLHKVISSAGIPLIGTTAAKDLANRFGTWSAFREAVDNNFDFTELNNFGDAMATEILEFIYTEIDEVAELISFSEKKDEEETSNSLEGITFVVTGKLKTFKNRDAITEYIAARGGKVTGSVTKKTNYLINNDNTSTSAKNLTAQKLGVQIITEDEFLKIFDK